MVALGVDGRRRGVEILRLAVADRTSAEGDDFAGRRVRGHHEAIAVEVVVAPLAALDQARLGRQRKVDAVALELGDEAAPRVGGISEGESLDRLRRETAPIAVRSGRRATLAGEHSGEVGGRDAVRLVHSLALASGAGRARVLRLELDPGFARERADGVREGEILGFLQERDYVAAGAAAEALEKAAIGVNVKRRRLLGMKRAKPNEVVSALAQRHVLPDEARDVDASPDFVKSVLIVSH